MDDPYRRPVFTPALFYRDPFAALDWLERAFGFERSMVITESSGALGHAEMRFGEATIYIGGEWADFTASPSSVGGKNTQVVRVRVQDDIDGRCERAQRRGNHRRRAGGAVLRRTAPIAPTTSRATIGVLASPSAP